MKQKHEQTGFLKVGHKIALLILAVPVFLIVSELILTVIPINTYFENRFFLVNRSLDYPDVFKKDRRLLWRLRPSQEITSRFFEGKTYRINSHGLRGDEIGPKSDRLRILLLGNSCTFGWGMSDNNTYAYHLERMINADSTMPPVEVINGGVPGYSSFQGRRFYTEELYRLEPDIIMIMFGWNDQWAAADNIQDKDIKFPPDWILVVQDTFARLKLYSLLRRLILGGTEEPLENKLSPGEQPQYRVSFDDFLANLKTMAQFARRHGTGSVILTSPIPSLAQYYPPGSQSMMHRYHEYYNMMARQAARNTGSALIDVDVAFLSRDSLYDDAPRDPIHFNERGHRAIAEIIYNYFKENPQYLVPPEPTVPFQAPWDARNRQKYKFY
jgi:lysophospholipase L1-like esterase